MSRAKSARTSLASSARTCRDRLRDKSATTSRGRFATAFQERFATAFPDSSVRTFLANSASMFLGRCATLPSQPTAESRLRELGKTRKKKSLLKNYQRSTKKTPQTFIKVTWLVSAIIFISTLQY